MEYIAFIIPVGLIVACGQAKQLVKRPISRTWIIQYVEKHRYLIQKQREDYIVFSDCKNLLYIIFDSEDDNVFHLSKEWKIYKSINREKLSECVDECNRQIGFQSIMASYKRDCIRVRSGFKCNTKRDFKNSLNNYLSLSWKYYCRIKKIYSNFDEAMKLRDEEIERCLYREQKQAKEITQFSQGIYK